MENKPHIIAILSIRIADSPVKGLIYILEHNSKKAAFCTCRGQTSDVYFSEEEAESYHLCREWFMDKFDGFVQTRKLEGDEEIQAINDFKEFIGLF